MSRFLRLGASKIKEGEARATYFVHWIVARYVYTLYAIFTPVATVRITPKGHRILSQLATESSSSMPDVLKEALEAFRRQRFLEQAAAAYETLAADASSALAYRKELAFLEGTLGDGLDAVGG